MAQYKLALMTQKEVVRNYKIAKNKAKQIEILAELNGCSKETIREILLENGIDWRRLPRNRKEKKDECKPAGTPAVLGEARNENEKEKMAEFLQAGMMSPLKEIKEQQQKPKAFLRKEPEIIASDANNKIPDEVVRICKFRMREIQKEVSNLVTEYTELEKYLSQNDKE